MLSALLLLSCKNKDDDTGVAATPTTVPEDTAALVTVPDVSGVDLPSVFTQAMRIALTATTQVAWQHVSTLATRQVGCPDFYAGGVEAALLDNASGGVSWVDDCRTPDMQFYSGWVWWDSSVYENGNANDYVYGRTSEGSRRIMGDGTVGQDLDARYVIDGEADDYYYRNESPGYSRWIYRSNINATVSGADLFTPDSVTPKGWRSGMYLNVTGGDIDLVEMRGDVYWFEPLLVDRFDSMHADIYMPGPRAAGPEDCPLEPLGWIGVRDPEARWYDVVFLPRYDDDIVATEFPNDPLSECDGCGTLYIQGIESGEVCFDLSFVFTEGIGLPSFQDYVLSMHELP